MGYRIRHVPTFNTYKISQYTASSDEDVAPCSLFLLNLKLKIWQFHHPPFNSNEDPLIFKAGNN